MVGVQIMLIYVPKLKRSVKKKINREDLVIKNKHIINLIMLKMTGTLI